MSFVGTDADAAECRDCPWSAEGVWALQDAAEHEAMGHGVTVTVRVPR